MMRKISFLFAWFLLVSPYQVEATCDPNIPADVTGDCKVDFNDFAIIASDWLKAAVPHEWVATYNGPGNFHDWANAVLVDELDNIYVSGNSYSAVTDYDWATLKYDPDGNQLWAIRYDGPANGLDWAHAMDVDTLGNVYVTGFDQGLGTGFNDCATIKYNPNGNEVWVARYNGPGNGGDSGKAIAVDSNDNIYVTGASTGSGTGSDYATIKYSPDSNAVVWVARYNSSDNLTDVPSAIAVDSSDNIYVTGVSYDGIDYDYVTIKYSPDNNQPVWVARYNGPGNADDIAHAIAVDSNDNIYVTGGSWGASGFADCATIKYSPDSNQPVWIARYSGVVYAGAAASAVVVDGNDNIYVTGASTGSGTGSDYTTIKYSPDSNQPLWVARYNGPGNDRDRVTAMVIDDSGNIYVTGHCDCTETDRDWVTIKYDPDGNQLWVARYNGPNDGGDSAWCMALDSSRNIYVVGESTGSTTEMDYATVKYSPEYTCTPEVMGDFNYDCKVDIYDLRIFCQSWLECNLDPPQDCW